ncbi:MAG: hypothetical protein C4B59_11855 [Candidatus Methanogaster sp.]|uniref:Uncharacterized protein n=1 Tax=Candidatus Methanogaster sp. TaxID=3386292 RepID=A0AC61L0F2_9EURY|nr:MAG: hypothetical protein C4B59_11855 [ANME-2 cluster archaeon]
MKRSHIVLSILLLSLLVPLASADSGPRGTVQFNLIYETSEPVTLIDYRITGYEDEQCISEIDLRNFKQFECAQKECRARMFPGRYNRLILNFSDRDRQSEVFNVSNYGAEFDVRVTDSELIVEDVTPISVLIFYAMPDFALLFTLNILLELILSLIFIAVLNKPMKVIAAVIIANLISFPVLWQLLAFDDKFLLLFEALIVLCEGLFIYYFMKKVIPIYQSLTLSLILNICSFIFGMLLGLGPNWRIVPFFSILLAIIVLSILALTYLRKRYSARFIRVFTIAIMVLACAVAGLLVMDRIAGGPLLSAHKLSCEPEYYTNITAEELREFSQLANAIKRGKFVEMKNVEADRLLDYIIEGQSEQHTSSSPQKLYVRVKDEYYEVRTTWI